MDNNYLYLIYGMNIMFYFMTSWIFWKKGNDRLSRLVMILMSILGIECIKDLFFLGETGYSSENSWMLVAAIDMVAIPLYAFILRELCQPGKLTTREMILHEISFAIFPLLFVITDNKLFYNIEVAWALTYGIAHAIWAIFAIPRYNRLLKATISYDQNVNLGWLRIVLVAFILILTLWLLNCYVMDLNIEAFYLAGTMLMWMFICYFIYKHESVLDELTLTMANEEIEEKNDDTETDLPEIERQIQYQFVTQKLFLDPHLRLSDVALKVGTNRTYLSRFFNQEKGHTFYDYVNGMRLDYAEKLLLTTSDSLAKIAESSGFNSLSTFRRAFATRHNCSPAEFRRFHNFPKRNRINPQYTIQFPSVYQLSIHLKHEIAI